MCLQFYITLSMICNNYQLHEWNQVDTNALSHPFLSNRSYKYSQHRYYHQQLKMKRHKNILVISVIGTIQNIKVHLCNIVSNSMSYFVNKRSVKIQVEMYCKPKKPYAGINAALPLLIHSFYQLTRQRTLSTNTNVALSLVQRMTRTA